MENNAILKKYGFTVASKYRKNVVIALGHKPKTPKEISLETNCGLTHISRALQELLKKDIVRCVTPNRVKGRIYQLTVKGEEIFKLLKR